MNKPRLRQHLLSLSAALLVLGGCSQSKSLVGNADSKFFKKGEYKEAIALYKSALAKEGTDKAYLNAQIAEAYRLTNHADSALPYYKEAETAGYAADSVKYYYAEALKASGNADEAKAQFAKYASSGTNMVLTKRAKSEADNIDAAKQIAAKFTHFEVSNVSALNTTAADFSPVLHNDELYFTSGRGAQRYNGDGTSFLDLYTAKITSTDSAANIVATPMPKNLNPEGVHNASAAVTKDGKTMVFARSGNGSRKGIRETDLFISHYKDGKWSDPEPLTTLNNPTAWDACPSFSPDGKNLYFASNRPGGQGGIDIYRAQLDAAGFWSKVTNMGETINTPGDEMFPYVSDDQKLYFSSDGHPTLGKLDIFVASRDKDTKKITVENLGTPINSSADDFGISFKNAIEGYFSSNRAGGKGDDDIYYFKNTKDELRIVKFNIPVLTKEKEENETIKTLPNTKVKLLDDKGVIISELTTDAEGKVTAPLAMQKNYTFLAEADGYYARRENFTTYGKSPSNDELRAKETTIDLPELSLVLDKIKLEKTIVMDNIYYDFKKWDIKDTAAMELDKLVTIMNDNPKIHIELSSHTDNRGSDEFNMALSQKRAEAAVNYIIGKGIAKERITAKGYGESKPIIENAMTEEDFQKNRRTEFKVVKLAD